MFPRIALDQSSEGRLEPIPSPTEPATRPGPSRHLVLADWEAQNSDALMLYLSGEPRIGEEFSYNDLRWKVIDYRDGWVAELLV